MITNSHPTFSYVVAEVGVGLWQFNLHSEFPFQFSARFGGPPPLKLGHKGRGHSTRGGNDAQCGRDILL